MVILSSIKELPNKTSKILELPSLLFFYDYYTPSFLDEIKHRFEIFSLCSIRTFELNDIDIQGDIKLIRNNREGVLFIKNREFLEILEKELLLFSSEGIAIQFFIEENSLGVKEIFNEIENLGKQYVAFAKIYKKKKQRFENLYRKEINLIRRVIRGEPLLFGKELYLASLIVKAWISLGDYNEHIEDKLMEVVIDFSKKTGNEVDFIAFFIPALITEIAIEKEKIDYISPNWNRKQWRKFSNLGRFINFSKTNRNTNELHNLVDFLEEKREKGFFKYSTNR